MCPVLCCTTMACSIGFRHDQMDVHPDRVARIAAATKAMLPTRSFVPNSRVRRHRLRTGRALFMATIIGAGTVGILPSPVQATGITFRSATFGTNLSTTTLQLPFPTGIASGDVLLAGVSVRGKPVITAPVG